MNETLEIKIVPENPLALAVSQSGLEVESAQSLHLAFGPLFAKAEEWRLRVAEIQITDASQTREMKLARESRLALRDIRLEAETVRKKLKEESLRKGKAIDGVANVIKFIIEPLEEHLLAQEKFVERAEAQRKAQLKVRREEQLRAFNVDTSFYDLSEMPEAGYQQLLENTIAAHEAKKEAARKAEADRIAREKAEAEERERVRVENEKLKREAAEQAEAMRQERLRLQALAEVERQKAEAAAKEAAAKAKKERDAIEAAARKEREAREKIEAEIKRKADAEAKEKAAKLEAERKAAKAPEREKLMAFAMVIRSSNLPEMKSAEGKAVLFDLETRLEQLAAWLEGKAETL